MSDLACPYCRNQDCATVAVVRNPSVKPSQATIALRKTGILCETQEIRHSLERKLDINCPICQKLQYTNKELKKHFHDKHPTKSICRVCFAHDYVFSDELEVYTHKELQAHLKKDHATCPFCDWHFYSNKELNKHCKTQHESCFICERDDPEHPQYFSNYGGLKDHFINKHYMCMVPTCLEDKFIVFGSRIELQNHMLEQHKSLIDVKEMQRVNVDDLPQKQRRPQQQDDFQRRYSERLRINAKGDNGLIDQVLQANHTFETKKVPADVFLGTYESVLGASSDEITLLVEDFSRFANLSVDKKTSLERALVVRRPASSSSSSGPSSSASSSSGASASSSGPTPASRVAFSSSTWAGRKKPTGPLDVASLPRLGGGAGASKPVFNQPASRKVQSLLPRQPAKPNPKLPSLKQTFGGGGPQTRLPELGSRGSTRASWIDQQSSAGPSASVSRAPSALASPSSSASSSSSSLPNFGSLPSLPTNTKKQSKGSKKIVRII